MRERQTVSRISKKDRQAAAETKATSQSLYANRVRIYPKAVYGPDRIVKWAIMIPCLMLYYVLPWIRWYRGPGQPDQAVLLDVQLDVIGNFQEWRALWIEFKII